MKSPSELQHALSHAGLIISEAQAVKLVDYFSLLNKWNHKHNLTRIKERHQVNWHLLDAASIIPYCQGDRILDVGSGAGIPGIPLSILMPNKQFVLIDNQKKKYIFLKYVINDLSLDNVKCEHQSVERYQVDPLFDTITSRAFAQLAKFIQLCSHLLAPDGRFVAMKGAMTNEELENIPEGFRIEEQVPLKVPGIDERYAIIVKQQR